jgi:quinol monooxygenase YgiN
VGELQGISRIRLREGMLEEFKRLSGQFMEIVQAKDTGTLQFAIYFNDDESECIVLERYRDFEALREHGTHIGELAQEISMAGSVTSVCLGEPSAVLREQLAGGGVQLFTPYRSL